MTAKTTLYEIAGDLYDSGWVSEEEFERFEHECLIREIKRKRSSALIGILFNIAVFAVLSFAGIVEILTSEPERLTKYDVVFAIAFVFVLVVIKLVIDARDFWSANRQLLPMQRRGTSTAA